MSDVFDGSNIKVSDYPADYIPAGAEIIIGGDYSKDGCCTVKGFYDIKTGEYHIQEVVLTMNITGRQKRSF